VVYDVLLNRQDAFNTEQSMGMPTTVGSFALVDTEIRKNAALINAVR
jgi:hypothetical protein